MSKIAVVELTVGVPSTGWVLLLILLAALRPLRRLPVAARPLGTCTKIAGNSAAAATPCLSREYKLAQTPTVKAPSVFAIWGAAVNLGELKKFTR